MITFLLWVLTHLELIDTVCTWIYEALFIIGLAWTVYEFHKAQEGPDCEWTR
jgi:hypothetical protein